MPGFCFTVDLDRDVNVKVSGRPAEALSIDRGAGPGPRFTSSLKGLEVLVGILDEMGLPCTFFAEGRTLEVIRDHAGLLDGFEVGLHGYNHECFAEMGPDDAKAALMRGADAVRDVTGRDPVCFRAPYMSPPGDIADFLEGTGIRIDSSQYANASECRPRMLSGGIAEVPVCAGKDDRGKEMYAYLWPLHEGGRKPIDYVRLARTVPDDGCFVLADHTWHIVESRETGVYPVLIEEVNLDLTRKVLRLLADLCPRRMTVSQAASAVL